MVNKVILIGNLGADPEIRTLESGVKVGRIRIATTERYIARDTQERKEHTEWHTITLWRGLAGIAEQYLRKGSKVYVEGRLRSNEWVDEHQQRRVSIEVMADNLVMLDGRQDSARGGFAPQGGSMAQGGGSAPQGGGYSSAGGGYASASQPQQSASQPNFPRPSAPPAAPSPRATATDDSDDLPF